MFNIVYTLTLFDKLQEWSDKFKNWIMDNYSNPVLWVGILVIAFLFFKIMFSSLNKD